MMQPVRRICGLAIPFGAANVDTDTIINARHLKVLTRGGLAPSAFAALREKPHNIFDRPEYQNAPILIAGENFGCGSSREHAVWALVDRGIEAIIAPSFADIFATNAFKNGLLLVTLDRAQVDYLLKRKNTELQIDLERQTVVCGDAVFTFEIDPFRKHCLLRGLDEIDLTMDSEEAIQEYERRLRCERPWIESAVR